MLNILYHLQFDIEEGNISQQILDKVGELFKCQLTNSPNLMYQIIGLIEKVSQLYNEDDRERYTEYVALLNKDNYNVHRDCFDKVEYRNFENMKIPIPCGYAQILTSLYGDYMKPIQGCSSHGYPYYKEQEFKILEAIKKASLNMSVTEYCDYVMFQ